MLCVVSIFSFSPFFYDVMFTMLRVNDWASRRIAHIRSFKIYSALSMYQIRIPGVEDTYIKESKADLSFLV